ncbi:ketosteroid isomerase-like protein [Streptosporangium becharense]|uniref:Ketosteroid isomerase-like protein n=1 Tax=Streptosporangium becharense TaxID=1816182 RepID=A0A7W9IL05_9ACTN|nr:nuclear transport factor 2 family protein [Streptosporangium becharense]MBB2911550.1 ketosteroid isomerase-like protein [Streptosporangium becharense]MBB5822632.1 ketosteroid isomerase-like protein [Streptosporangium becharense]
MKEQHNAEIIQAFYEAFARRDADAMERCYHPDVTFSDPVFQHLAGRATVMAMWRMLMGRSTDLQVDARDIAARRHDGTAHWTAHYTFSRTGRKVVNEIDSFFRFEDGLIVRHRDHFDLGRWSRMAVGRTAGRLFGWTPMFKAKIRGTAMQSLQEFMSA